jgi:hypothetical protein
MTITLEDLTVVELASSSNLQTILCKNSNRRRLTEALSAQREIYLTDGGVITVRHESTDDEELDSALSTKFEMLEATPLPDGSIEISLDLSSVAVAQIEIGWQVSKEACIPV